MRLQFDKETPWIEAQWHPLKAMLPERQNGHLVFFFIVTIKIEIKQSVV